MNSFPDHFSSRAADYAVFRPTYPRELIEFIVGLCAARELAWDAGTGNGQAAVMVAEHFARVVATDASGEQISRARAHPKITYRVAREGESGLDAASVDLVTVAQALHWFDHAKFYAEAKRVMKRAGVIAVWTYDDPRIDPQVDAVVKAVHDARIRRFWPPERRHVNAMYMDLDFPFAELEHAPWSMTARLTREQWLGYVGTWSAVTRAREAGTGDPVVEMREKLDGVWRDDPGDVRLVTWPMGLRVGRIRDAGYGMR